MYNKCIDEFPRIPLEIWKEKKEKQKKELESEENFAIGN